MSILQALRIFSNHAVQIVTYAVVCVSLSLFAVQYAQAFFTAATSAAVSVQLGDWVAPRVQLAVSDQAVSLDAGGIQNGQFRAGFEHWFVHGAVELQSTALGTHAVLRTPGWSEDERARLSQSFSSVGVQAVQVRVRVLAEPSPLSSSVVIRVHGEEYFSKAVAALSNEWQTFVFALEPALSDRQDLEIILTSSGGSAMLEVAEVSTQVLALNPTREDVSVHVSDASSVELECTHGVLTATQQSSWHLGFSLIPDDQFMLACSAQDLYGNRAERTVLVMLDRVAPTAVSELVFYDEGDGEVSLQVAQIEPDLSTDKLLFFWQFNARGEWQLLEPISLLPGALDADGVGVRTLDHQIFVFAQIPPGTHSVQVLRRDGVRNTTAPQLLEVIVAGTGELPPVRISEIQWAGSELSAYDEWLELENRSSTDTLLAGWQVSGLGVGTESIELPTFADVSRSAQYVISRYSALTPETVLKSTSQVARVSLRNTGEVVRLFRADGALQDSTPDGAWVAGEAGQEIRSMQRRTLRTPGSIAQSWFSCTGARCTIASQLAMPAAKTTFATPGMSSR